VAKGRGVSIIPFPDVEVNEDLTFVALIMKFHSGDQLTQDLAEQVYYILASRAQLFQGAIIRTDITRVNHKSLKTHFKFLFRFACYLCLKIH